MSGIVREFGQRAIAEARPSTPKPMREFWLGSTEARLPSSTYPRTDGNFSIVGGFSGNFKLEGNAVKWLSAPGTDTLKKLESGTANDFIAQIMAEIATAG